MAKKKTPTQRGADLIAGPSPFKQAGDESMARLIAKIDLQTRKGAGTDKVHQAEDMLKGAEIVKSVRDRKRDTLKGRVGKTRII